MFVNNDSSESNEELDLAWKFVTETSENIFLTGKAGTGKTTFLKRVKSDCPKNIVIAAPTGVAAINAAGVTLHSLFQLPFHPLLPTKSSRDDLLGRLRFNRQRQQLFRKMELLIIDEISMVRCDVMDAIDAILRSVRRSFNEPFGGVQLLCIGDLYQLPPVAKNHEWSLLQEFYNSPFFFDSLAIKEQMPIVIELEKIYRQKENSFVSLLNKVRNNEMAADDFEALHLRYAPAFKPPPDEKYITLTSHNNQADQINYRELHQLAGNAFQYEAVIEGEFPENSYPAEGSLSLKVGAQVMFLKNDVISKRFFNGKIGVVKSLDHEEVVVDCDGDYIQVFPETWQNTRYVLNRADGKLEQENLGSFTQFPLRLAWAITIHKSQGLTFEKVMIDAASAFSSGQVYVALSRCTTLEGIVLLSKIPAAAIRSNQHVVNSQKSFTARSSLAERFAGARQLFSQHILEEIFNFELLANAVDGLSLGVDTHRDKLNDGAIEWMASLKENILHDRETGKKFIRQIDSMMKGAPPIEENILLQERIVAAAGHFLPKLNNYRLRVEKHPLVTEHRETATAVNEQLNLLSGAIDLQGHNLEFCNQPFSLSSFLKHRLAYAVPKPHLSAYAAGKAGIDTDTNNPELYTELKNWRDKLCQDTGIPIYMVANRNSLADIATYLPLDKRNLQQISGFGKVKAEKYGDDIIDIVEGYCNRKNLPGNVSNPNFSVKKSSREKKQVKKTDSKLASFQLFKAGKSIAEIATERNFAASTIQGHLSHYIETGELNIDELIEPEKQALIKEVAEKYGEGGYKNIFEHLPPGYTYAEIRQVMAEMRRTDPGEGSQS